MNCNDAMAALVASLEDGTTLNEEQREHIRTCPRCREMLDSAKDALRAAPSEVEGSRALDAAVAAAEHEVRRKRFWRGVKVLVGVVLLLTIFVATLLVRAGEASPPEALFFASAGFLVALLAVTPVLLLFWAVRGTTHRLYKRLRPGRMLSGVCLGLAEASKFDVRLLRIIFVVLIFFDGAGLVLYILLDLAMPVHPDDRQYLLRFRLRRWWQRRMSHAAGG